MKIAVPILLFTTYLLQVFCDQFQDLLDTVLPSQVLSLGGIAGVHDLVEGLSIEGKEILDIGCGKGGLAIELARSFKLSITAIDPNVDYIREGARRLKDMNLRGHVMFLLMQDTKNLNQFPDDTFDIALLKETLIFVPGSQLSEFLNEIYRVLVPGGHLVVENWILSGALSATTQEALRNNPYMKNLITRQSLQQLIAQSGFIVESEESTFGNLINVSSEVHCIEKEYAESFRSVYGSSMLEYLHFCSYLQDHSLLSDEFDLTKMVVHKPLTD